MFYQTQEKLHWQKSTSTFSSIFEWAFFVIFPTDHVLFFKFCDVEISSYSFMIIERQRLRIRIKEWTSNTFESLNFYRCHSALPVCFMKRTGKRNFSFCTHCLVSVLLACNESIYLFVVMVISYNTKVHVHCSLLQSLLFSWPKDRHRHAIFYT